MLRQRFDVEKAAHVAAAFIELTGDNSVGRYALIKWMYAADRKACELWGCSMTGDQPVSMEHGPVLSRIVDLTKGTTGRDADFWYQFFTPAEDHVVTQTRPIPDKDRLSPAEMDIIREVYAEHGRKNFSELKRWSHSLGEYQHTEKGHSSEIPAQDRLREVGKTPEEIARLEEFGRSEAILRAALGDE